MIPLLLSAVWFALHVLPKKSVDNGLTWEWNWFMYMSKITKIVKFRIKENSERSITKKK